MPSSWTPPGSCTSPSSSSGEHTSVPACPSLLASSPSSLPCCFSSNDLLHLHSSYQLNLSPSTVCNACLCMLSQALSAAGHVVAAQCRLLMQASLLVQLAESLRGKHTPPHPPPCCIKGTMHLELHCAHATRHCVVHRGIGMCCQRHGTNFRPGWRSQHCCCTLSSLPG